MEHILKTKENRKKYGAGIGAYTKVNELHLGLLMCQLR